MAALISVKAGRCHPSAENAKTIVADATPGTITLKIDRTDDLLHFVWTPRRGATVDDEFDLIVFPGDASFVPYTKNSANTGRIYVLKFSSSSQRHFFWWQTKAEGGVGDHSRADRLAAKKINLLLQNGGDIDETITDDDLLADEGGNGMDIDDEETSRQAGADGGRAVNESDPPFIPPNSLSAELSSSAAAGGGGRSQAEMIQALLRGINIPGTQQQQQPSSILSLPALLPTSLTTTLLDSPELRKRLLENLPPTLTKDITTEGQEKELLRRVLHSPQFSQAAVSLTHALREGGLRGVADSLGVKLDLTKPDGGVEMFLAGVKKGVEEDKKKDGDGDGDADMEL